MTIYVDWRNLIVRNGDINEWHALIRGIRENPDKLVYRAAAADWLYEAGNTFRAELMESSMEKDECQTFVALDRIKHPNNALTEVKFHNGTVSSIKPVTYHLDLFALSCRIVSSLIKNDLVQINSVLMQEYYPQIGIEDRSYGSVYYWSLPRNNIDKNMLQLPFALPTSICEKLSSYVTRGENDFYYNNASDGYNDLRYAILTQEPLTP